MATIENNLNFNLWKIKEKTNEFIKKHFIKYDEELEKLKQKNYQIREKTNKYLRNLN